MGPDWWVPEGVMGMMWLRKGSPAALAVAVLYLACVAVDTLAVM